MRIRRLFPLVLLIAATAAWTGCRRSTPVEDGEEPFVLGDMLDPFDPPTLDELDAVVEWVDQPVLDSMALMRQRQAGEEVLATVPEALALKNDSPQANTTILSALGRLAESDGKVDWNAAITRHAAGDVKSTKAHFASSTIEFDVIGMTGIGLIGFDWNFRPFGNKDVVESWQTSKDHLYDKMVLRKDVTWSDGKPFTAHDVEFSFKVSMSSKVPIISRSGAEKMKWVKAYDDHTVVFFQKDALATNVWNIHVDILPKHVYEKSIHEDPTLQESEYHVKHEDNPVVAGAYEITERVRGQRVVLTRREGAYMYNGKQVRDKPYFKEIRFRVLPDSNTALLALKSGDLEEMEINPEQWQTQTGDDDFYRYNTKVYGIEWTSFHFGWNCKSPFFSDIRVRKAMSYAFDHQELLDKLRFGLNEPSNGIFHFTSRWAPKDDPPKPYKRDVEKAEALLEEADWIDHDGDGIRDREINGRTRKLEFAILTSNRPDRIAICNLLKENLSEIGIICHVRPTEWTVLQDLTLKHKFEAYFGGWGTGADPFTLENIFKTGKERNFGEYSNPEVDRLFEEGVREFDPKKREEIYGKIHKLLYADQPYTWLYFRSSFYGFNKHLRGYVFSPRGPYNYGPGFSSMWRPAMK